MEDTQIKEVSPIAQLLFLMLLSMFSGMLFSYLGVQIVNITYGLHIFGEDMALLQDPNFEHTRSINLILVVCQHIGAFILPALIFWQRMQLKNITFFVFKTPSKKTLTLGTIAMVAAVPTIGMLAGWNESITFPASMESLEQALRAMEDSAAQVTETVLRTDNVGGLFLSILIVAMIPAFGEELLFRGIIQQIFSKWTNNPHIGIWLAALLFSFLHMQFFGFIPRFLLGGMLGYLFWFSGNIWVPIAAHFANNALAVILTYMIHQQILPESINNYGANASDWLGVLISIIVTGVCLRKMYQSKKSAITAQV